MQNDIPHRQKMSSRTHPTPHDIKWLVGELNGSVEIGAESLVRDLIRQLLEHPALSAGSLWEAVTAIGTGSRPERWRKRIEVAFNRLPKNEKTLGRRSMLAYYHMIGDADAALPFCSLCELNRGHDVMFAMDILLDRAELGKARAVARKALGMLERNSDGMERDEAINAIASYEMRTRRWDDALQLWAMSSRCGPLARNAAVGTVEIHLARALDALSRELESVAELRRAGPCDTDRILSLPGNEEKLLGETEKELLRLKRGLQRLLPTKRRRALGLV